MRPFTAITVRRELYTQITRFAKRERCSRSLMVAKAINAYSVLKELSVTSPGTKGRRKPTEIGNPKNLKNMTLTYRAALGAYAARTGAMAQEVTP